MLGQLDDCINCSGLNDPYFFILTEQSGRNPIFERSDKLWNRDTNHGPHLDYHHS
jgi:hypothetical protein